MNESIEELLASGAVVPDRPGSKRLVPAPQSVVVPVGVLNEAAGVLDCEGYGPLSMSLLSCLSAPALSSLAGGEMREAVARIIAPDLRWDRDAVVAEVSAMRAEINRSWETTVEHAAQYRFNLHLAHRAVARSKAEAILAALSPEAPARDGVDSLVDRFAAALKDKLHAAAAKYGHDDAWMRDDWRADLIRQLGEHVQKGDPRDVAAYCAFAWHHGWSVADPASAEAVEWSSGDLEDLISDALDDSLDMDWTARDGAKAAMRAFKKEGIVWGGKKLLDALEEVRNVTHPGLGYSSDDAARRAAFSASDAALTPRHEAPADDDDGPCTCCDDTGITIQTERPCACTAGTPSEAPAEGAGERTGSLEDLRRDLIDLVEGPGGYGTLTNREGIRLNDQSAWVNFYIWKSSTRSSAPEAREGEAVAWISTAALEVIKNGEPNLVWPSKDVAAATALYTHPAAPSADNLRIAVEALEPFEVEAGRWEPKGEVVWPDVCPFPANTSSSLTIGDIRRAAKALAALKAEV